MSDIEKEEVFSIPIPFLGEFTLYQREMPPGPSLHERIERLEEQSAQEDGPCAICGEETNHLAGDPSQWPLHFVPVSPTTEGEVKPHHVGCVQNYIERGMKLAQAYEAFAGEPGAHERLAEDLGMEQSPYERIDELLKALNIAENKLMLMGELDDEAQELERQEGLGAIREVLGSLEERSEPP